MNLRLLLGTLFLLPTAAAHADSWASPRTAEVFSASREHFVRVVPGESLGDTFGFTGQPKGKYATAEFYRRAPDRSYTLVAEVELQNPMAPVEFFVSDDGRLATVDNWHNVGYGKVVAIYDAHGKLTRSYELRELFQPDEIAAFPASVSSIHWRDGPAYVRADQKTLLVTVRSGSDLVFGLESGAYRFCERHDGTYRCRTASEPRKWTPGSDGEVTR